MSELDFLEQAAPEVEEPQVEAQPEPQAAEAEPAPEPQAAPEPPAQTAPIEALLSERDKRKAAEAKAAELQERIDEAQRASQPAPTPEASLQAELYAQRMDMSRMFAESRYGADEVARLHDWAKAKCDADPLFNEAMRSSRNPYEEAAQARNREMIAAKVTPDRLAAFEAWEAAQQAAAGQAQTAPTPATPAPPRSLVSATNAGGATKTTAPENAYEALPFN